MSFTPPGPAPQPGETRSGQLCEVIAVWQWGQAWVRPVANIGEPENLHNPRQEFKWRDAAHAIVDYEASLRQGVTP